MSCLSRHEICQKFYTTRFWGQKFYTLKVRLLHPFLLTMNQPKCIFISSLSISVLELHYVCIFNSSSVKSHLLSVNFVLLNKFCKKMLFSGKIYTAGTNFKRPPVATVVTNLNSALSSTLLISVLFLHNRSPHFSLITFLLTNYPSIICYYLVWVGRARCLSA